MKSLFFMRTTLFRIAESGQRSRASPLDYADRITQTTQKAQALTWSFCLASSDALSLYHLVSKMTYIKKVSKVLANRLKTMYNDDIKKDDRLFCDNIRRKKHV